jgi:hypothetical protein
VLTQLLGSPVDDGNPGGYTDTLLQPSLRVNHNKTKSSKHRDELIEKLTKYGYEDEKLAYFDTDELEEFADDPFADQPDFGDGDYDGDEPRIDRSGAGWLVVQEKAQWRINKMAEMSDHLDDDHVRCD